LQLISDNTSDFFYCGVWAGESQLEGSVAEEFALRGLVGGRAASE